MLPRGAIHVSMSTISVALAKRLKEAHSRAGQRFVSAPVLGRPEAAAAAKLFIVSAGDATAIDECEPLFDVIGMKGGRQESERHRSDRGAKHERRKPHPDIYRQGYRSSADVQFVISYARRYTRAAIGIAVVTSYLQCESIRVVWNH